MEARLTNAWTDLFVPTATLYAIFDRWRTVAEESAEREDRLAEYREEKDTEMLHLFFAQWRDRAREKQLSAIEFEVLLRRQELVLRAMLGKWTASAQALPAIRFRNTMLKRKALQTWVERYPERRDETFAASVDREQILRQALHRWKEMTRQRRTFRAAA